MIRNDFVSETGGIALGGTDGDGDSLGPALEAVLKTCDNTLSPPQGGLTCGSLQGCTAPASPLCAASLRDSDQDGLRDDVEVYGAQLYSASGVKIDGGYMARYGANPAHYDLFYEVDYQGNRVSDDPSVNACIEGIYGDSTFLTRTEANRMAEQYASATQALFPNRDGIGGIRSHFDIGGLSNDPPFTTDTASGNWGGSNCYVDIPPCASNADCASGGMGVCCLNPAGCSTSAGVVDVNRCTAHDPRWTWMVPARRWLFRSIGKFGNSWLGSHPYYASQGYGASAAAIVHETGHQAGLTHEGPLSAGMGILGHGAVNRLTRMNYAFGFFPRPDLAGSGLQLHTRMTFSAGTAQTFRPLSLPEARPLLGATNYDLVARRLDVSFPQTTFRDFTYFTYAAPATTRTRVVTTAGSEAIDLNEDDQFTPAAQTVEGRPGGDNARLGRSVADALTFVSQGGPEVVKVGIASPAMYRIRVTGLPFGGTILPSLQRARSTTFTCSETPDPNLANPRFAACPFVSGGSSMATTGTPVTVAADAAVIGTDEQAVVVYRTDAGAHGYGLLNAAGTWTNRSTIVTTPPTPALPAISTGNGFPSVARIGGSQTTLLVYRTTTGAIVEQIMRLTATGGTITPPATVVSAEATRTGGVGVTTLQGTTLGANGVLMVTARTVTDGIAWDLRRRVTTDATLGTGTWSLVGSVFDFRTSIWGRPVIEIRTFRVGGTPAAPVTADRLVLSWRAPNSSLKTFIRMSPRNALLDAMGNRWTNADPFVETGAVTAHAAEMSFDTRFAVNGLRGVWSEVPVCDPLSSGACPVGSNCLALADTGISGCVSTSGSLVQAIEHRTPGADGVQPMALPDFNEWPQLRYGFCQAYRDEATSRSWAPTTYRTETAASCATAPVYAR